MPPGVKLWEEMSLEEAWLPSAPQPLPSPVCPRPGPAPSSQPVGNCHTTGGQPAQRPHGAHPSTPSTAKLGLVGRCFSIPLLRGRAPLSLCRQYYSRCTRGLFLTVNLSLPLPIVSCSLSHSHTPSPRISQSFAFTLGNLQGWAVDPSSRLC